MSTTAITTVMAERQVYRRLYLLISLGVVLFDRLTKYLITANLALHDSVRVIPGLFQITHVQNQGAAFGLFADSPVHWKVGALILFSLLALVVVSILLWRNGHVFSSGGLALVLILGGAVGCLWYRVPSSMLISGSSSMPELKPRTLASRASFLPTEGSSCIKPTALAGETAPGLNSDSWRISEATRNGSS